MKVNFHKTENILTGMYEQGDLDMNVRDTQKGVIPSTSWKRSSIKKDDGTSKIPSRYKLAHRLKYASKVLWNWINSRKKYQKSVFYSVVESILAYGAATWATSKLLGANNVRVVLDRYIKITWGNYCIKGKEIRKEMDITETL